MVWSHSYRTAGRADSCCCRAAAAAAADMQEGDVVHVEQVPPVPSDDS